MCPSCQGARLTSVVCWVAAGWRVSRGWGLGCMCRSRVGKAGFAFQARIFMAPFPVSIVFTLPVTGAVTSFPVPSIRRMTERKEKKKQCGKEYDRANKKIKQQTYRLQIQTSFKECHETGNILRNSVWSILSCSWQQGTTEIYCTSSPKHISVFFFFCVCVKILQSILKSSEWKSHECREIVSKNVNRSIMLFLNTQSAFQVRMSGVP